MKILSVVGTRPNFVKLAPIARVIASKSEIEHVIVNTGQHYDYEMSQVFFEGLSIPPSNYDLKIGAASPAAQISHMIRGLDAVITIEKPDVVLVYGDTTSTLAGALTASKTGTKLAHVEAGLRNFDRTMTEEMNRVLTDNMSDYLFAPTNSAMRNIANEHLPGVSNNTGDVTVEILDYALARLDSATNKGEYVLLTTHRAENVDNPNNLLAIVKTLEMISEKVMFPMHPRIRNRLMQANYYDRLCACKNVTITKPLGYLEFVDAMRKASKIITDSGGVQKEAYILGVPCITLRDNTEWIETVNAGWNRLVGLDPDWISSVVKHWLPNGARESIFGNGRSALAIVDRLILINELLVKETTCPQ